MNSFFGSVVCAFLATTLATAQQTGAGPLDASLPRSEAPLQDLGEDLDEDFDDFALLEEEDGLLNRIRFNAFADITLGTEFGGPASSADRALFDAFGTDANPLNTYGDGFNIVGADFVVTMDLTDRIVFQSEVNFQVMRGGETEFEIDPERFYIDYRHDDLFNVQAGLFFTPIGYHNRFLYSRAWLMNSIQVPDLFEEELNLVPTHTIGVNAHGRFDLAGHSFGYVVGIGNGRATAPDLNQLARDSNGKEITALLEWYAPGYEELIVGLSGWTSEISTFQVGAIGNSVDITTATPIDLREWGFNPYITYFGDDFNVLAEFVASTIENDDLFGGTIELSLNWYDDKVHPYVRYDFTDLPPGDQGDYYGLRLDGNTLTKNYIPEFDAGMIGINYDVSPNTRLKAEYVRHFDGVREENAIVFQVAWGF